LSTIILRGSTKNILEDIERAIDDGVSVYRSMVKEPIFVPGAGSTEIVKTLFILDALFKIRNLSKKNNRFRSIQLQ
jgi:T-complex protein 1 subunit theta